MAEENIKNKNKTKMMQTRRESQGRTKKSLAATHVSSKEV